MVFIKNNRMIIVTSHLWFLLLLSSCLFVVSACEEGEPQYRLINILDFSMTDEMNAGEHSGGEISGGTEEGGTHSGGAHDGGGTEEGGAHSGGAHDGGDDQGGRDNGGAEGGAHSGGVSGGVSGGAGAEEEGGADATIPLQHMYIKSSHNSYEGGPRGTIINQLNSGIRSIEYDLHDNDFMTQGYRLGHIRHNDSVALGGDNPNSTALPSWLDILETWSDRHPQHAPLILILDLKDNLTDNRSYAEGNLTHLNKEILGAFSRIWRPEDGVLDVESMRGHTLCVLSGDQETRLSYLYDQGTSPAVTANQNGVILEVHDSGSGHIWYWSGELETELGESRLSWRRHGRYDTGRRPSVLLDSQGRVIEVHQSESRDRLWTMVGHINTSGELYLGDSNDFADGSNPTLRWAHEVDGGPVDYTEILVRYMDGRGQVKERRGEVDYGRERVSWGSESTIPSLFDKMTTLLNGVTLTVSATGGDLRGTEYPPGTLRVNYNGREELVRYEQVCFVEWQRLERSSPVLKEQLFGAVSAEEYLSLPSITRETYLIRGWGFSRTFYQDEEIPQMPATDNPYHQDYHDIFLSRPHLDE